MKIHLGLLALLAAGLSSTAPQILSAQEEAPFPGIPVKATVTVEPRHGKESPRVRAEDVAVTQQGKDRYKVTSWQPILSAESGVQLFVLIDDSLSSTDVGSKLGEIRNFINSQPANVSTGVAYVRNGGAVIAQSLTTNHEQAAKSLRLPTGDGISASPYFGLQDLLKHWPQSNGARQVVLISDGIDPYWDGPDLNDPYVQEAIHDAQRDGVVVNAIYARGVGHFGHTLWRITWGQNFLSELADRTGGEAYYLGAESVVTFSPYFKELNERMQNAYSLTFQAQPGKKPGFQRIKVTTEVPNAELVAPSEVYVPGA